MSDSPNSPEQEAHAIAGMIANGVAGELSRPIRDLREQLAGMVDALDHHVANAKGPTPYPWKQVGELREKLAESYLRCRSIARLAGDLATAVSAPSQVATAVDVNLALESALNLANHRFAEGAEVFVDYGTVPAAQGAAPRVVLAIARLLLRAAHSTPAGTVRIQSRRDEQHAVIRVIDSGLHDPDQDECAIGEVRRVLGDGQATVDVRRDAEQGTIFELRMPLGS